MSALTVSEVMHLDVPTVDEDMPYKDIVRNLAAWHVRAVVVLDAKGRVTGLVSASDLIARPADTRHRHRSRILSWRDATRSRKAHATTAAALMSCPVVQVSPDTPLVEAARIASDAGVRELVVVDVDGRVAGMVERVDLLADYLRPDDEIRDDIREWVVLEKFMIDPTSIAVSVRDGIVTLAGCVDTRPIAAFLADAVRAVPGVVEVEDRLSWRSEFVPAEAGTLRVR